MGTSEAKLIVVSAVNFTEGGPRSVMQDCLSALSARTGKDLRVLALVHQASLYDAPGVTFLEFPRAKRSWFLRLYYEYFGFRALSRRLKPFLWLSLHDITPNVEATRQAVYCHNPAPFHRLKLREFLLDPVFALFNLFYIFLYRINIEKNDYVVVQQDWLRHEFEERFGISNVIVAHPTIQAPTIGQSSGVRSGGYLFIYPALPRVFKNIETIVEAVRLLEQDNVVDFRVILTITGRENRYSRFVADKCTGLKCIELVGPRTRQEVFDLYRQADALIFPSRLETWGMPLTEFAAFGKPILVANEPYAHETLAGYDRARFFEPGNARILAAAMRDLMQGRAVYDPIAAKSVRQPCVTGWDALADWLLQPKDTKSANA